MQGLPSLPDCGCGTFSISNSCGNSCSSDEGLLSGGTRTCCRQWMPFGSGGETLVWIAAVIRFSVPLCFLAQRKEIDAWAGGDCNYLNPPGWFFSVSRQVFRPFLFSFYRWIRHSWFNVVIVGTVRASVLGSFFAGGWPAKGHGCRSSAWAGWKAILLCQRGRAAWNCRHRSVAVEVWGHPSRQQPRQRQSRPYGKENADLVRLVRPRRSVQSNGGISAAAASRRDGVAGLPGRKKSLASPDGALLVSVCSLPIAGRRLPEVLSPLAIRFTTE